MGSYCIGGTESKKECSVILCFTLWCNIIGMLATYRLWFSTSYNVSEFDVIVMFSVPI